LPRYVEVPLHNVVTLRMGLHVLVFERPAASSENRRKRSAREGPLFQAVRTNDFEEWCSPPIHGYRGIEHRQDVKHPEAPAYRGFAVVEGVPGKTDARLKIAKRGIRKIRITQMRRCGVDSRQIRELSASLRQHRREFVT